MGDLEARYGCSSGDRSAGASSRRRPLCVANRRGSTAYVEDFADELERMLRDRLRTKQNRAPKVKVETQIHFDDTCSAHSTLVEVIAQDQPGLLYRISSQFAREKCNIEIALIDTEGQTAIDVFYLTAGGAKLSAEQQELLRTGLLVELAS